VFFKILGILVDLDLQFMAWAALFLIVVVGITIGLAAIFLTTLAVWQIVKRKRDRSVSQKDREFDAILVYIFRSTTVGFLATSIALIVFAYCIVMRAGSQTLEKLLIYTIVTAPLTSSIIGGIVYWDSCKSRRKRRRRKRF
jgi:small-conductance mechanosensitive channel